jgi:hypothetical protein
LISTTYARNRSSNQLLSYQLPSVAGFQSYLLNFPAVIQNRNWEFLINSKNIESKNISWTSSFNLTIPQNKLIAFPNLATSTYSKQLIIGQPIGVEQLFHFAGVDPGTGSYIFTGRDGNAKTNPDFLLDRNVLISTLPKLYGGLQNMIIYKAFQLDVLFQFVKQTGFNDLQFWNGNRTPGSFYGGSSNQPVSILTRWQKQGDNTSIAKFSSNNNFFSPTITSDYRYTDASFIRLKNVALSWDLPMTWTSKAGFKKCRIYAHAQNLLTITNYKGLDPESQSILSPTLPPLRVITAGVQLGL